MYGNVFKAMLEIWLLSLKGVNNPEGLQWAWAVGSSLQWGSRVLSPWACSSVHQDLSLCSRSCPRGASASLAPGEGAAARGPPSRTISKLGVHSPSRAGSGIVPPSLSGEEASLQSQIPAFKSFSAVSPLLWGRLRRPLATSEKVSRITLLLLPRPQSRFVCTLVNLFLSLHLIH